ncbi:putative ribonuclease H-like domain-containing protein [Tanacetum coccineum]
MRPFGCPLTILNTLDSLGKFEGKSNECYLLGYSTSFKAFRVYNKRAKRVEENLHIDFLEDQPNVAGTGPNWMFDLDFLTNSMNYIPVSVENQINEDAGTQDSYVTGSSGKDKEATQEYILLPLHPHRTRIPIEDVALAAHEKPFESSPKDNDVQDSEDVADKEGQHQMTEDEQVLHDELEKMIAQEVVWILVDLPYGKKAIGTKLVAQGFRQKERIDYDEVFAPIARIEAIRLFLAFASYMGFTVYQMDVKSAFLYGTIEEEVYVHQPPGFVDPTHPNKVYKVIKVLYGLHQAPRAWYETLSSFLMENGFRRGTIDKTLFIKKNKSGIMLVQVYVDDFIFGSAKKSMCTEFEDSDILKKFDYWSTRTTSTPIESNKPLVKDEYGKDVDVHVYRSMIGSLMYLTASRPDIMFAVYACARFQVTPKVLHLNAVKRIFSDYKRASLDKKSTTCGCQFLGRRLISWQ